MLAAACFTIAFLPLYLALRRPYARLPLHIDTGYYVSNHTIATGKFRYAQGWNAHFAGCSKVLPEVFYSSIYRIHDRARPPGPSAFVRASRLYASLWNYLTASIVGLLATQWSGGNTRYYYAAVVLFALISSEPQRGVYFECGELFEAPCQALAVLCLLVGTHGGGSVWVGLAAFVWAAETYFVKLSSAIGFVALFAVWLFMSPADVTSVLLGGGAATALYSVWLVVCGRDPRALLRGLRGHEASFGQRADRHAVVHRLWEKLLRLMATMRRQPVIPALALAGAILVPEPRWLLAAWIVAVMLTYGLQAADCWYYQIPLLAPLAILAAPTAVALASSGAMGVTALGALALVWLLRNALRARRLDARHLNLWCWEGAQPAAQADRNFLLERAAPEMAALVAGRSLLVYGPFNQAYVLLRASWRTPIVAPEHCLEDVCPGWQRDLNRQLVADPPAFILDTANAFAAAAAREQLGLDYRLAGVWDGALRLYQSSSASAPAANSESVLTFAPQSAAQIAAEARRAGFGPAFPSTEATPLAPAPSPDTGEIIAALLRDLSRRGFRRLGVYGAGRFTVRHAEAYRNSPVPVAVVLDDRACTAGFSPARIAGNDATDAKSFLGWPLAPLSDAGQFGVDAIVVSSDRFAVPMRRRAQRLWDGHMTIVAPALDGAIPAVQSST